MTGIYKKPRTDQVRIGITHKRDCRTYYHNIVPIPWNKRDLGVYFTYGIRRTPGKRLRNAFTVFYRITHPVVRGYKVLADDPFNVNWTGSGGYPYFYNVHQVVTDRKIRQWCRYLRCHVLVF